MNYKTTILLMVIIMMITLIIIIKTSKNLKKKERFDYSNHIKVNKNYSYYNYSLDPNVTNKFTKKPLFYDEKTEFNKNNMEILLLKILNNNEYKGAQINNSCENNEESIEEEYIKEVNIEEENIEAESYNKILCTHNKKNFKIIREWLLDKINKTLSNITLNELDINIINDNKFDNMFGIKDSEKININNYKIKIFNNVFKNGNFFIEEFKILKIKKDFELKLENYQYIMRIYRKKKDHHFFIYCDSVLDLRNNNITLINLDIIGIIAEDKFTFKKMIEVKFNLTNNYDKKPYCLLDNTGNCNNKIFYSTEKNL